MSSIILAIEQAWNFSSVIEAARKSTKYKNVVFIGGGGKKNTFTAHATKIKCKKMHSEKYIKIYIPSKKKHTYIYLAILVRGDKLTCYLVLSGYPLGTILHSEIYYL